jgi:hypothetical protein
MESTKLLGKKSGSGKPVPNVFLTLTKYALRQDENSLTESLVYLLQMLLEREPEVGKELLGRICGVEAAEMLLWPDSVVSIRTQFSVEEGRPDIVVRIDPEMLIFIEVKLDSSLSVNQLEVYFSHLGAITDRKTGLVLLTRSRHGMRGTTLDPGLFHHVCWYEISGWLSEMTVEDPVAEFLAGEFIEFLRDKELSMEKVTWEYIRGVPAMQNLYAMIGTAIAEVVPEEPVKKTIGASWSGYYVNDIFIGFRYNESLKVIFENHQGANPDFKRTLMMEDAHFFSLSAGEQLECLIEFLQEGFSAYDLHGGSAAGF